MVGARVRLGWLMLSRRPAVSAAKGLRIAVQALPVSTAAAMLEGVRRFPIITGAFVEPDGSGVCLAVAANRAGNPGHPMGVDQAWDRFCGVRNGEVRPVTRRELGYVIRLLEDRVIPLHERVDDLRCVVCDRRFRADLHGACGCCGAQPGLCSGEIARELVSA